MKYFVSSRGGPIRWLIPALALALVLAVACGTAATLTDSEPAATSASQPPLAQPTQAPQAMVEPASEPEQVSVNPGKITWMAGDFGNEVFDIAHGGGNNNVYTRVLHDWLIHTTKDGKLIPAIATDWTLSEDFLTWTVTIREGVKFHDGTEMTAEDIFWSWQHYWSPESVEWVTYVGTQSTARNVEKIEMPAPNQVSVTSKFPDASWPAHRWSQAGPSHSNILPKRDALHDREVEVAFDLNPVGVGVMKMVRRVPADIMELERWDDYYYQTANGFDEDRGVKFTLLDLRLIPEEATRVAAIRAGEADVAPVSLDARQQIEAGGGRMVFGKEGSYFRIMLYGCYKPAFACSDRRVRQALSYALDKELMRDELFGAEVMEIRGWAAVTPGSIGYSPDVDPLPYDPEKARQLLSEAGYKVPGSPEGKDFGKLQVNTWQSVATPFLPESAQLAADMWRRELGIEAEAVVGDEAALQKKRLTGDLDGQILWRDNETRLDASGVTRSYYGNPEHKGRLTEDPEILDMLNEAMSIGDPEVQAESLNKLYRRLRDESFELGLGYINIPWAVGSRIDHFNPWPLSFYGGPMHTITLK